MPWMTVGIAIVFCVLSSNNIYGDFSTSVTHMEHLIPTINVVQKIVNSYIELQEFRLGLVKTYALSIAEEVKKANEDTKEYLSNPIDDYILIKRLTVDWNVTKNLIVGDFDQDLSNNITVQLKDVVFPSNEDLDGAAVGLTRLQDTYQLDTTSVARRELSGISNGTELTCDDCFLLGKTAYNMNNYYLMYSWMIEALNRCQLEKNVAVEKWKILDYLAYGSYKAGNNLKTLSLAYESLKSHPIYETIIKNQKLYQQLVIDEHMNVSSLSDLNIRLLRNPDEDDRYKQLCSHRAELPVRISSQLRCRYVNYGKPFLMLAPLKEEEAYLNPRILLFREVLYPSEISVLKNIALSRLERSRVTDDGVGGAVNYRISKVAWLMDSEHPVLDTINRRMEDMTSFNMDAAEILQVANYGIGGYYEPHYDDEYSYLNSSTREIMAYYNDRIATLMFYMNNVKQGGATVFPLLDVVLWPEEGSAAFWYNSVTSGDSDSRMLHGACPVLQGSKWVANKWIHKKFYVSYDSSRPAITPF